MLSRTSDECLFLIVEKSIDQNQDPKLARVRNRTI